MLENWLRTVVKGLMVLFEGYPPDMRSHQDSICLQ